MNTNGFCFPAKTDQAFKEFLDARNPTKQHSSTLESYLIKPVQRVLKYPLLLRELVSLTDADSEEHYHLTGRERIHKHSQIKHTHPHTRRGCAKNIHYVHTSVSRGHAIMHWHGSDSLLLCEEKLVVPHTVIKTNLLL